MKLIDAVYEVLKDSAAPMGGQEIERAIRERGLYEAKGNVHLLGGNMREKFINQV